MNTEPNQAQQGSSVKFEKPRTYLRRKSLTMATTTIQHQYRRIPIDFLLNPVDQEPSVLAQVQQVPSVISLNMIVVMQQQQQQKPSCTPMYSPLTTSPPMKICRSAVSSKRTSQLPTPRQDSMERSYDSSHVSAQDDDRHLEKKQSTTTYGSQGITKRKQAKARRKWTVEEDETLRNAVKKYGLKNWKCISSLFPGRNGDRVRLRYQYYLVYPDNVRQRDFSPEEDELIMKEMGQKTNRWAMLSEQFGRSAIAIKNRSHVITRKMRAETNAALMNNKLE